ncbi:Pre-mRNA-splicing factor, partial [Nowakowskiella sp. JEL0078]
MENESFSPQPVAEVADLSVEKDEVSAENNAENPSEQPVYDQAYLEQYYAWYQYQLQLNGGVPPPDAVESTKKNIEEKPRDEKPKKAARRQVGRPDKNSKDAKGVGGIYNIFYDRWYTEGERRGINLEKALTRCNPEKDSGSTKGKDPGQYFCVHFSHGCCTKGPDCQFIHRVPVPTDRFELTRD